MQKLMSFFNEVKQEIKKVSWASKKETKYSVITILLAVSVFATFFLLFDAIIYNLINFILNIGAS